METSIINALLEWGMAGLFIAYMVYSKFRDDQRNQELQDKFLKSLETIQQKTDANEEKLRGRYDAVIAQYQDDKTTFRVDVAGQIAEAIRKIEGMPFDSLAIQIEAVALNQRNSQLSLEKIIELFNQIQEQKKLERLAKTMADK
tara:strand:- start:251 stop:682 length:432 start_codon:yes stop_codon:yes gene_type:complete